MNKLSMAAAILALGSVFATAAQVRELTLNSCTRDGHKAALMVNVDDTVLAESPALPAFLQSAWAGTASGLSAAALTGPEGMTRFVAKAKATIDNNLLRAVSFTGPPVIGPARSYSLDD